jgi:hypothetical protein
MRDSRHLSQYLEKQAEKSRSFCRIRGGLAAPQIGLHFVKSATPLNHGIEARLVFDFSDECLLGL